MEIQKQGATFALAACLLCTALPAGAVSINEQEVDLYGFLSWRVEKVFDELSIDENGRTVKTDAPREIAIPSFNIMSQYAINDKFKTFFNLNGEDGEDFTVRNIWGEYTHNQYLNIRVGKTYRRFGLYNEVLDAVPTYMGIEPPELFDGDHLIVSRTTLLMVHGWTPLGDGELRYSWSTDNGEGGPNDDAVPMGFDVRYDWNLGDYTVGISGYTSNGDASSDVGVGEGSPDTGVLPWMASDDFTVFGGYAEFKVGQWWLQGAYWMADHDADRDPASVVAVINNAGINDAQRRRFLLDDNGAVDEANIDIDGDYDIKTWYVRAGYSFMTKHGEWMPYFQWDHFDNPETIQSKTWGGDNEAGLADDGKFSKGTIGIIYRPIPQLAVKLDASAHFQEYNGDDESYPEIRLDVSYIFGR